MTNPQRISRTAHYPKGSPQAWAQDLAKKMDAFVEVTIEPYAKASRKLANAIIPGPGPYAAGQRTAGQRTARRGSACGWKQKR